MCELVAVEEPSQGSFFINEGEERKLPEGLRVTGVPVRPDGLVFQCWHPEDEVWSTMLPPVKGMAWEMPPGSKMRLVRSEEPPAPSMVEQVEAVEASRA